MHDSIIESFSYYEFITYPLLIVSSPPPLPPPPPQLPPLPPQLPPLPLPSPKTEETNNDFVNQLQLRIQRLDKYPS
ncbi:hypothetical protein RhiirA4_478350 [Rhizophagus irregularis]|uniref:Uncharacterized protein n=1 Tax=Rhizophagus irregularis TaxID=588596 RepID=A0A2I1HEM5_9GLOM|nr:hypothetical protein RhiirA4_478350 [Rhizophagus irregularis]